MNAYTFKHARRNFRVTPDGRVEKLTYDGAGAPKWLNVPVTPELAAAAIASRAA